MVAIKGDPRAFAQMLEGVRNRRQVAEELAADLALWGRLGVGIFFARAAHSSRFLGLCGIMERTDGRGLALRFAFWPEARGQGVAREAAGAALRFAHERAGLKRVVAVAREDNFASRIVLGSIGMHLIERFQRAGYPMLVYESRATPAGINPAA